MREVRQALGAGDAERFVNPLYDALARWPLDPRLYDLLATVLKSHDRFEEAATILLEGAEKSDLPAPHFRRAFSFAKRSDRTDLMQKACELSLSFYPDEVWPVEPLLRMLEKAGNIEALFNLLSSLTSEQRQQPAVAFQNLRLISRFKPSLKMLARENALTAFASSDRPSLWLGRLLRFEGDSRASLKAFKQAVEEQPGDEQAGLELANTALTRGWVGECASALLKVEAGAPPEIQAEISAVRHLYTTLGGSLEDAAQGVAPYSSVSTPGSAVEWLCENHHVCDPERRHGVLMVGGSLAGGGAERIVSTLFSSIRARRGDDAVRLCLFEMVEGEPSGFYLPQTGIPAAEVLLAQLQPVEHPLIAWLPRLIARRTQAVYNHIVAVRPAVVHASLDMANICAAYAALLAGVPRIILHVHNMRPTALSMFEEFHPDFDRCYRAFLRRPEVSLVGVAEPSIADYMDWAGITSPARTHVVHNGFDFHVFDDPIAADQARSLRSSLGLKPGERLVGTAIRFTELKRPALWVDMAERLIASFADVHFVMFGDGELWQETEERIKLKGLSHRIHLPGRVTNLHQLLGAMDLFVLSSRTEGLPNVLIEAQAAGVPVVTFDVGGARDTFLDGQTGVLVREQTAEALADALRPLLRSPARLTAMKSAARVFVRERFAVEQMIDKMLCIFDGEVPPTLDLHRADPVLRSKFTRLIRRLRKE